MTIEIALVISIMSVVFGIYQGVCNLRRNARQDNQADTAQLTTVIVKLESIGDGVTEIKSDLKNIKDDIKEFREWKAKATQQIKAMEKIVFRSDQLDE